MTETLKEALAEAKRLSDVIIHKGLTVEYVGLGWLLYTERRIVPNARWTFISVPCFVPDSQTEAAPMLREPSPFDPCPKRPNGLHEIFQERSHETDLVIFYCKHCGMRFRGESS